MSDASETICPQCGNAYKSIGAHWTMSSDCSHPRLSSEQVELLTGALLAGKGSIPRNQGGKNPSFTLRSTNKAALDWYDDHFPVTGTHVREDVDSSTSAERLAEMYDSDPADIEADTVYYWATRSLPHIIELQTAWLNDEQDDETAGDGEGPSEMLTPPTSLRPTPLACAVLFAFSGRVVSPSGVHNDTEAVVFQLKPLRGDIAFWEQYLDRFAPMVVEATDVPYVYLRDSVQFFRFLSTDHVTEGGPIPGCESKWPADPSVLMSLSETAQPCPTCGQRYAKLGNHWARSDCPFPNLTPHQREVLDGLLCVGGSIVETTDNPDAAWVRFTSTHRGRLEWIQDQFGILVSPEVSEHDGDTVEFDSRETPVEYGTYYTIGSRDLPALKEYHDTWYTADGRTIPPSIERSPTRLRAAYIFRGHIKDRDPLRPAFPVGRDSVPEDRLKDLCAPFDPTLHRREDAGAYSLVLNDVSAFFDYIGTEPPTGMEDRWPPALDTATASPTENHQ